MKEPISLEPLFPDRLSAESLQTQLIRSLRTAIKSGLFPPSSRLLPSRELAKRLALSRNTVTSAFDQLIAEGYLEARVGAGTFVAASLQTQPWRKASPSRELPCAPRDLSAVRDRLEAVGSSFGPLRVGAPDFSAFPIRAWRRLQRENTLVGADLDYSQSSGLLELRQAISRHIAQFRGVVAEPDQIVIVEGTQSALHLIAFTLMRRGEKVAIEDPCYQLARAIFAAHGLVLHGVRVDDLGIATSELPPQAALAYVTPSHQFPLGGAMPLLRRTELLAWARDASAYIIEDDYDSEFDAHPLPSLQSLDREDRVIYVGTLSKTLAPGLRVGYVVAPRHLAPTFRFARAISSLGASGHLQKTIAEFILQGYFGRHVRRMTAIYARRRRILVDALTPKLPRGFHIGPAQTGLHVAINGPNDFDDVRAANALAAGNRVLPISLLCVTRTDCKGLLIGFSAGSDADLRHAASMLAASLV